MEKNKISFGIRTLAFLIVLFICLGKINKVLVPKFTSRDGWPTTSTFLRFYELEPNSVDVIFLGSSHMVSAVNPIQLKEKYGISAYNLGSEQQSLFVSYYWLKETLKYQEPKMVVVDSYFFDKNSGSPLNSDESFMRKSFDYMKWSAVKREAIHELCELDEQHSEISYYLPNIRFHSRWKNISEYDFDSNKEIMNYDELLGYKLLDGEYGIDDYEPIEYIGNAENFEPVEIMVDYMDKIVELCKDNDIELVLMLTPFKWIDPELNYCVKEYADANGLELIDFNIKETYDAAGYDFIKDNSEISHVNSKGAVKITDYIGKYLISLDR